MFFRFRFLCFCKNSPGCIHGGHITHGVVVLVDRGELCYSFHAYMVRAPEVVAEDEEINKSIKINEMCWFLIVISKPRWVYLAL